MPPKLGIIAGGGDLPARLIDACEKDDRRYFVLAVEGQADSPRIDKAAHGWVRLGAGGRALDLLRENEVEDVVFAGRIERPNLWSIRPDWLTVRFVARVAKAALGDDGLLRAVVDEFESHGFRVVGPETVLPDLLAPMGVFGRVVPDEAADRDIARGIEVARLLGTADVGQSVVVQGGMVLGLEAAEGTDALIERCGSLKRKGPGGVLVKVKKPQQERRMDLPVIGVSTVETAARASLRGIAVQAGHTLVLARADVISAADKAGLFVIGVEVPE